MINEISNIKDYQSQVHKSGNRNLLEGTQTNQPGEFSTLDIVEISNLKPVQPVSEDKNEIHFSSDSRNAEKNIRRTQDTEGSAKTEDSNNPLPNAATSAYDQKESGIGTLLNKVV
ncbi:MAG: hypothetical protein HY757_05670 [Nitrospirae bacterium]|nr:hypothetical protein [Nitrospirota bacterium]